MVISPQNEDDIRSWLSSFMGDDDARRYFDLDYAMSIIKQGELCWKAAASIAVQISLFNQEPKPTKAEKALAQHIADSAIEPLEALVKSLLDKSDKESDRENARTLFHARFALGGLYIVTGDIERAADILTQVASTKSILEVHLVKSSDGTAWEQHGFVEGPERVSHTSDIVLGKTLASDEIVPQLMGKRDYEKALYLLTQAAASFPWEGTLHLIEVLVDIQTKRCIEASNPGQWVSLIDTVAEIASICDGEEEIKESVSSPSERKMTTSAYWAWKFGQIVGDLWLYGKGNLVEPLMEECSSPDDWKNGLAFVSLFSECDEKRDWEMARAFYLEMWERTSYYSGTRLFLEGADSGLYWAMRVGLADKFLKPEEPKTPEVDRELVDIMSPKLRADIQEILDKKFPKSQPITKEDILELIQSGESKTVEFKSSARWDYKQGRPNKDLSLPIIETVAAFLNTGAGKLLIGVSDDGEIRGLDYDYKTLGKKDRDGYKLFLVDLISENIDKGKVFCSQYVTIDFYDIDGKDVCLLNIQHSLEPVYVKEGKEESFYIRLENSTRRLNTREAHKYISDNWPRS